MQDSIDKIVTSYFATVTRETFTYKGKEYQPQMMIVSPQIFRGFTCPASCGACCKNYSLDYLPVEYERVSPPNTTPRNIRLNEKDYLIYSDLNLDHGGYYCRNLILENGRCGIYPSRAFSCDFELIRTIKFDTKAYLTQKLYGRGWAMTRTNGTKGSMCEMTPITQQTIEDVHQKLIRLKEWTDHFELTTVLPETIHWVANGPHTQPLVFNV